MVWQNDNSSPLGLHPEKVSPLDKERNDDPSSKSSRLTPVGAMTACGEDYNDRADALPQAQMDIVLHC